MHEPRGKTYRPWQPQHYRQEAHSPEGKLPEGDLVFFLLDTVPKLDMSRFYALYEDETRGAPPFDPQMMVCLLLYAYCAGVFSSRKIAQACERTLAVVALVGADRPDFRTISDCRKLHLEALRDVFGQVLRVAGEAGLVKRGNVATDGTKMQGNASRHKAMSYGSMHKEAAHWREDIEALVTQAHHQDADDDAAVGSRRGDELPTELARREDRLATIEAPCDVWKRRRKLTQTLSASGGPRWRRNASAWGPCVATKRPNQWTSPQTPTHRPTAPIPNGTSCGRTTKAGSIAAMPKRVWMRLTRASWRVTSPLHRTTNNKRSPWRT